MENFRGIAHRPAFVGSRVETSGKGPVFAAVSASTVKDRSRYDHCSAERAGLGEKNIRIRYGRIVADAGANASTFLNISLAIGAIE